MKFEIDKEVLGKFPNLKIGLLIAKGVNNKGSCGNLLEEMRKEEKIIRNKLNLQNLVENPKINDWRNAYLSFGSKPKTYKNSVEALIRRILKGEELPNISKIVNIYNMISIKNFLPCGGDDLDKIDGAIKLITAKGNESFTLLGSNQSEIVDLGEIIYQDSKEVLCRRWNWRECDKTKMTENTSNLSLVVEGLENTSENEILKALEELETSLKKYCGGEYDKMILNKEKRKHNFSI